MFFYNYYAKVRLVKLYDTLRLATRVVNIKSTKYKFMYALHSN